MTAGERISIKMRSIESSFVIGHQIYCLHACMRALFRPEIGQVVAVKGLNMIRSASHTVEDTEQSNQA